MRRTGGARVNSSQRVKLARDGAELDGWVLNVSRGGVRIILEDAVVVGEVYVVSLGEEGEPEAVRRQGRVVWVQNEPDGAVAGLEYTDRTSSQSMPAVKVAPPTDELIAPRLLTAAESSLTKAHTWRLPRICSLNAVSIGRRRPSPATRRSAPQGCSSTSTTTPTRGSPR